MNRLEDILKEANEIVNASKIAGLIKKADDVDVVEVKKKPSKLVIVFAIIGAVVAIAAAVYGVYRFLTPDYLDDFEDDFDDDDSDFFEDDDIDPVPVTAAEPKAEEVE